MKEQRELLFRLMKKLPDGSYEIVGYQVHNEEGRIMHAKPSKQDMGEPSFFYDIFSTAGWIDHDRIDQYTGENYTDGGKVFERDEAKRTTVYSHKTYILEGVIRYGQHDTGPDYYASTVKGFYIDGKQEYNIIEFDNVSKDETWERTGIQGVL